MNTFRPGSYVAALGIALLIAGCGGGSSSSGASSLQRGLIHQWKFDGNAQDSAGTLNGTLVGAPSYEDAAIGQGIVLDGNTTGVNVPLAADLQFQSSFSISVWAKIDALPPFSRLWASLFFAGDDRPGADPYALLVGPGGEVQFQLNGATNYVALSGTMPVGRFVLLTGTYDKVAGTMRFYMDGQLVDEHTGDTTLTPVIATQPGQHAGIGVGNANDFPNGIYNWGWDGTIDDVRVYNRALTAAEVQRLADGGQ